jgi:hypothetical protein
LNLMGGRALAVDVQRDLQAVRVAADRPGLRAAFAAAAHLPAGFVP